MTPEQISNLRTALCMTLGPYALFLSDADIISYRNRLQQDLNAAEARRKEKVEAEKRLGPLTHSPFSKLEPKS